MKGESIKIATVFFPQYFRQGRPLHQVILMVILPEKFKIKSIARRVMSSHILGDWIPDYRYKMYMSRKKPPPLKKLPPTDSIFYETD